MRERERVVLNCKYTVGLVMVFPLPTHMKNKLLYSTHFLDAFFCFQYTGPTHLFHLTSRQEVNEIFWVQ